MTQTAAPSWPRSAQLAPKASRSGSTADRRAFDRRLEWEHVATCPGKCRGTVDYACRRTGLPSRPVRTWPVHVGVAQGTGRPDPWVAEAGARELMVSRIRSSPDGRRARYMTPAESRLQLTSQRDITGVPPDTLSTVPAQRGRRRQPPGPGRGLPLVVLSPGFTSPRSTLTALAEDLASHGYVVAGIEHTYESFATAFPDGRATTCRAREAGRAGGSGTSQRQAGPPTSASCSAKLTGVPHPGLAGRRADLDPCQGGDRRHSAGGAAAISAMSLTRASAPASTSTAPRTPRSRMAACPDHFCWASNPATPRAAGSSVADRKHVKGSVLTWERTGNS